MGTCDFFPAMSQESIQLPRSKLKATNSVAQHYLGTCRYMYVPYMYVRVLLAVPVWKSESTNTLPQVK